MNSEQFNCSAYLACPYHWRLDHREFVGAYHGRAAAIDQPGNDVLAIGSAASLAASDIIYALRGRISKIYLVESVVEFFIIGMWIFGLHTDRQAYRSSVLKLPPEQ